MNLLPKSSAGFFIISDSDFASLCANRVNAKNPHNPCRYSTITDPLLSFEGDQNMLACSKQCLWGAIEKYKKLRQDFAICANHFSFYAAIEAAVAGCAAWQPYYKLYCHYYTVELHWSVPLTLLELCKEWTTQWRQGNLHLNAYMLRSSWQADRSKVRYNDRGICENGRAERVYKLLIMREFSRSMASVAA